MPDSVLMITVSGVRGLIGDTLTPTVALEFGHALGHLLQEPEASAEKPEASSQKPVEKKRVVIGRDSRPSGPMIVGALTSGLMSVGVDVVDVGVAATPSIALLSRFLKADAGVVVTASHNPLIWNGIKFLRNGMALPAPQAAELKQIYLDKPWQKQPHGGLVDMDHLGLYSTDSRAHAHHVQTVLGLFDARGIGERRYKVVLDSVNGAGCIGTPMLLGRLGCEMIHLNGEATGRFAHTPEPTKENLGGLCEEVRRRKAAVGFAQDPDADRLAMVDENGTYIGEEYTQVLGAWARLAVKAGPVVTNLSSSRMVDDMAARFGQRVYRTPVGEANVAGKMIAVGAAIGGEGSGGVIDLRVGPVRDSFVGDGVVLDLMNRTGKRLSELVREIPAYVMVKTKFECTPGQAAELMERVKAKYAGQAGVTVDTQDGVRLDVAGERGGWVQVRPSNTEPIARIMAEGKDEGTAQELIEQVQALR